MNNLKEYRLRLGLTQEELAEKLGMVRTTIVKYETGSMAMTMKVAEKLSKKLGCSADDLIGEDKFRAIIKTTKKGYTPTFSESLDGFITSFAKPYNDVINKRRPNDVFKTEKDVELYEKLKSMSSVSTYNKLSGEIFLFKESEKKDKK